MKSEKLLMNKKKMRFQIISYQLYTEMKKARKLITDIKLHALDCREDVSNKHELHFRISISLQFPSYKMDICCLLMYINGKYLIL